jgi:hypothetical protein
MAYLQELDRENADTGSSIDEEDSSTETKYFEEFLGAFKLAVAEGHLAVCQFLREWVDDIDAMEDSDHPTALMLASVKGHLSVCLYLIVEEGADPNISIEDTGQTALMLAAEAGHPEVCKCLVEEGDADFNISTDAPNEHGKNALDYALEQYQLIANTVSVESVLKKEQYKTTIIYLLKIGTNITDNINNFTLGEMDLFQQMIMQIKNFDPTIDALNNIGDFLQVFKDRGTREQGADLSEEQQIMVSRICSRTMKFPQVYSFTDQDDVPEVEFLKRIADFEPWLRHQIPNASAQDIWEKFHDYLEELLLSGDPQQGYSNHQTLLFQYHASQTRQATTQPQQAERLAQSVHQSRDKKRKKSFEY